MKTFSGADWYGELKALFRIAGPLVIAHLAQVGTGVVDTIMAGHYSTADLAAIAIGYNIWLPIFLIFIGVMLGSSTLIAQDFGAGRFQQIRDSLPQALWLALALGLVALPVYFLSGPLLALLQLAPETQARALGYLQAVAFGLPAAAIFQALRCHTQGIGILRPFAWASVIGFLANIPLNYAFIYGQWGAPELGATGCGVATAISMWLSPLLILFYIRRSRALQPYLPPLRYCAPDPAIIRKIWVLGLPMGLSFFLEVAVFSVIALLIARLGDEAVASHQIAINVWDMVYMFMISSGSALATRVGHAIGSGDRARVRLAFSCGAAVTLLVGALCMLVLLTAPKFIIAMYTDDVTIRGIAMALIQLASLFILFDASQLTASFTLRAFKDTMFPFVVLCSAYWFVTLPLGCWLGLVVADNPLDGAVGFWKAMIVGIVLSCAVLIWRLTRTLKRPLPAASGAPVGQV